MNINMLCFACYPYCYPDQFDTFNENTVFIFDISDIHTLTMQFIFFGC